MGPGSFGVSLPHCCWAPETHKGSPVKWSGIQLAQEAWDSVRRELPRGTVAPLLGHTRPMPATSQD